MIKIENQIKEPLKPFTVYVTNLKEQVEVLPGCQLFTIADAVEKQLGFRPIKAFVDNRTQDLTWRCFHSVDITFVSLKEETGMRTYERTLSFIAAKAIKELMPEAHFYIKHSLSKGCFCRIDYTHMIEQNDLDRIKSKMWEIIKKDIPFKLKTKRTATVAKMFRELGLTDKADLIEGQGEPYTSYYELDGYPDYFYGGLAPSTGYIYLFDIIPWMEDGLLMLMPNREKLDELQKPIPQVMMKDVIHKHDKLLALTNCKYVGSLNKIIEGERLSDLIHVSEAMQEKEIAKIAEDIAKRYASGTRVVLISGPSSSGKTTFCKRLQVQLITNYLHPHGLSLDDYFIDREFTPRTPSGDYDFENIKAIDLKLLGEQIQQILAGEEVKLPTYDFTTGKKIYRGNTIKLNDGDLLVIEGIHGLNPDLLPSIPEAATYKIYVSALTNVALDSHNRIPSTDNRLLRRIVRDYNYRGYSASETIKRWPSVREGEEKWVFPFQENANAMFNSAMVYEFAALREQAENILRQVPKAVPEFSEAQRLLQFLSYFKFVPKSELPSVSLLREFLGGSSFHY